MREIFGNKLGMGRKRSTLAERLRAIADELASIAKVISQRRGAEKPLGEAPQMTEEAKKRLSAGRCVQCGDEYKPGDRIRYGLDSKCYQRTLREFHGAPDWDYLVSKGAAAPRKKGGRPRKKTKLDEVLDAKVAAMRGVAKQADAALRKKGESK